MLVDEKDKPCGVVGDPVWDILGNALEEIKDVYLSEFNRMPTDDELVSIFNFCSGLTTELTIMDITK